MAGDTIITVTGNLTGDPELRFTNSGVAVCGFSVAVNATRYNRESSKWEDSGTSYYRCEAWRQLAENIAETLSKGHRVIVTGRLAQQHWEDPQSHEKRSTWKLTADAVGAELSWATATVRKMARSGQTSPDDPWASATTTRPAQPANATTTPAGGTTGFEDEPPF